jgi:hypothetical protein
MATYPTHKQSEDLLSDTRNLNQDSKQNQNFTMLYEITQTGMQDHSASPTHAPSPK